MILYSARLKLAHMFEEWCQSNNAAYTAASFVAFLDINNLLNVDAVCKKVGKQCGEIPFCAKGD